LGMPDTALFVVSDHTEEVRDLANPFTRQWDRISPMLLRRSKPSPHWCWECRGCEFFENQCVGVGIQRPIFSLPRLSEKKFTELTSRGIHSAKDIPADFPLTENQQKAARAINTNNPQVDKALINSELKKLRWPVGYLDFETVTTGIPLYPDVAPHEQIVTQYSLHVQDSIKKKPGHLEYLAEHDRDCREDLAKQLLEDTAACKSVVVYSSFEKTMIRGLAKRFPKLADQLRKLEAKLFDLEPVVRKGLVHPKFGGRSSIKVVLPVLAPDLSYSDLEIGDGGSAIVAFARMASGQMPADDIPSIRRALLEYCRLDTLAMVRLLKSLKTVS
jgi:predicted RecB family nuclease